MAQTFAVNSSNDLYLDDFGNIAIAVDQEALAQDCKHAARTILGEMVLQTNLGIPNFETIWNGVPNYVQYEAAVRTAILSVPGVLEVVSFTAEQINNTLRYTAVIRTIYGEATING